MSVKKKKLGGSDTKFAYALLAPSILLLVLLIGYPLIYNIVISCQDVPLNPNLPSEFVGAQNFIDVFTDSSFYKSVAVTLGFTVVVTSISTVLGLALSVFLNRSFVGKKLVNSIIILSYVVPAVCLIFTWRYMFNNIYGIINYFVIDVFGFTDKAPLWFDQSVSAFILVSVLQSGSSSHTHIFRLMRFCSQWITVSMRRRILTAQLPGRNLKRLRTRRLSPHL